MMFIFNHARQGFKLFLLSRYTFPDLLLLITARGVDKDASA